MSNWRLAKSLIKLREQLNALFPERSKISDGSIGDERHQKAGTSDHLPNKANVVTAIDVTFDQDPSDGIGVDARVLAVVLAANADRRIKYLIFDRKISVKGNVRQWKPYHGTNPHNHHIHISVKGEPALYDDESAWDLTLHAKPPTDAPKVESPKAETPTAAQILKIGDKSASVKQMQKKLVILGYMRDSDGIFRRVHKKGSRIISERSRVGR